MFPVNKTCSKVTIWEIVQAI